MNRPGLLSYLCFHKDKRSRLILRENPHFYANLPALLKAHGNSVNINPIEDFQLGDTFYVLTDRQEPIHIMIGNKILHSFGNLWRYGNTIIFKGLALQAILPPLISDLLTDICGRLMGESIVKASLRNTSHELYFTRFQVSTHIPRPFRTLNSTQCGLQPIVTVSYPWMGWEHFIDSPPMDHSANFCLWFITEQPVPNSPVCSKVITCLTTFANINIASSPLATNI